jgi:ribonuclease D
MNAFATDPPVSVPERFLRAFTAEDINALPLGGFGGPIRLVQDPAEVPLAVARLRGQKVLGFDTETRPSFRKGVSYPPALLQLASDREVYLFQLSRIPLTQDLADLLADPAVVKAGVSVRDDVRALKELTPFEEGGFVDLGLIAAKLGLHTRGLRNLAANFLGFRISKAAQRSNWGQAVLSRKQIDYAATDAWVSREICLRMDELDLLIECEPDPPKQKAPKKPRRRSRRRSRSRSRSKALELSGS